MLKVFKRLQFQKFYQSFNTLTNCKSISQQLCCEYHQEDKCSDRVFNRWIKWQEQILLLKNLESIFRIIEISGESHINFCTHWVIMTQRTWSPTPCCLRQFQIFDKSDSFPKHFLNVFGIKQANCIFEELSNLYLIVLLISFIPLLLWIIAENRTKLKKLFIWTTKSGGTQRHKHTNCTLLFISNCNNAMIWTEHYFCIISDFRNYFNKKRKNLWRNKEFL